MGAAADGLVADLDPALERAYAHFLRDTTPQAFPSTMAREKAKRWLED